MIGLAQLRRDLAEEGAGELSRDRRRREALPSRLSRLHAQVDLGRAALVAVEAIDQTADPLGPLRRLPGQIAQDRKVGPEKAQLDRLRRSLQVAEHVGQHLHELDAQPRRDGGHARALVVDDLLDVA